MFLLIDKPKGMTSHDVVDGIRKVTGEKRIGHAGTLDPNATGLLILGIGKDFTKKLGKISKKTKKVYIAENVLRETRTTDEKEGEIIQKKKVKRINKNKTLETLKSFKGKQEQIPPSYSAIKIKGKKAYELARKGIDPKLSPRKVIIYSIKLLKYNYPVLEIETEVSAGTYIRALARDIGEKLGCGAYLGNLRRIGIGKYNIKKAVKLGKLTSGNWKKYGFD